jgi:hypothetical protein
VIAPLREIGTPIMDTFGQIPAQGLNRIHLDPEHPVPVLGHHAVIRELPDDAIDAFAAAAGPEAGSTLLLAELRQAGGALARPAEGGGALSKLDASFVMFAVGLPMTPELGQAVEKDLDRLDEALRPWAAGGGYLNFSERPCDVDAILPPDICERLREIKRRWDPSGVIRANHELSLGPA